MSMGGRIRRWVLSGLLGLLVVAATVLVGLMSWDGLLAEASVPDPAVRHEVQVVRDGFGVPHIFGKTDADVAYGVAQAHAADDFRNIEEVVAAVRGRAGALTGEEGAMLDFARGLIQPNAAADAGYARLSPGVRSVLEGYARGLNDWVRANPGAVRLRALFPVNGRDILAGFMLRAPFFYGLERPLGALVKGEVPRRDSDPEPDPLEPRGSNAFAVSARGSDDGVTRLIVNSHQPWEGGVTWWELVVHSDEGWDFAGALFPGSPFPLLGHNRQLGWANTVNKPDLVDVYRLAVDNGRYRFDGQWRPLGRRRVWLRVKLGPMVLPVPRTLYQSVHGPVIRNANGWFALRWAGMGDPMQVEQYYRLNRAQDWQQWTDAMRLQGVAGTNFVYADATGRVAMIYNARFPVRAKGFDWKGILPGDTSRALWTAYEPWDRGVQVIDPPAGWVGNANNTPFLSTAPADEKRREDYPEQWGIETHVTNRALRYQQLFGELDGPISREALLRIKFDKGYARAGWAGKWVERLLRVDPAGGEGRAEAQALLRRWDWTLDGEGPADALAFAALSRAARSAIGGTRQPDPAPELDAAIAEMRTVYGRLDPPLGDMVRLRRGKIDLPLAGGPDALRAIYAAQAPDGRRVGFNGDGFMMLVEWPQGGAVRSESIHQFGAATIRRRSPHYGDQAALFAREQWKPVLFDRGALDASLKGRPPAR